MKRFHRIICFTVALCLLLAATSGCAMWNKGAYTPAHSQAGKDVVWLPTPQTLVETMLDMAKVTPSDYVIDLGSGDGRLVISAAKRGATAHGIEYDPRLVAISKRAAAEEGVAARATFEEADLFKSDFSNATVITMFLLPRINVELRPKILDMKPGTRIVSNTFDMEDWRPDQTTTLTLGDARWQTAHLWIVPAKVNGIWQLDNGQIIFVQKFQDVSGTLTNQGKTIKLTGKLDGDKISFTAGNTEYTGTVSGDTISGTYGSDGLWKAAR